MLVLATAVAGGLVGALLPEWLSRLPEPVGDLDGPGGTGKPTYASLGAARLLRPVLVFVTAVCFGLVAWRLGASPALAAALYITAVGILLCYIDIRVQLLPNAIILPSYLIVVALLVIAALISGEWSALLWSFGSGVGLWLLFVIVGLAYPAGVGFGDVKLIGVLALVLGWFGLANAIVGLVLAFTLGGLVSLGLIVTRRANIKSHLPFGPFLIAGFLFALLFAEDLVRWYLLR